MFTIVRRFSVEKRAISLFLVVCFIFSFLPINLFAATINPTPITLDKSVSGSILANGSAKWYKFFTEESQNYIGAYDINITSSSNLVLELYKYSSNTGKTTRVATLKNSVNTHNLSGCTYYYIKAYPSNSKKKASYKFLVKRHKDSTTSKVGGSWEPKSSSPIPTYNGIVYKVTYLDLDKTKALYEAMRTSTWSTLKEELMGLGTAKAINKLVKIFVITPTQAKVLWSIILLDNYSKIIKADKVWKESNKMSNGISITKRMQEGFIVYEIKGWKGSTIYGVDGYIGSFDKSDFTVE